MVNRIVPLMAKRASDAAAILLGGLALLTTVDVFCRRVFNSPIQGVFTITEVTFIFVCFFAFGQTHATGKDISIDLITGRFHGITAKALGTIADLLQILLFALLLWQGSVSWLEAWRIHDIRPGLLRIPMVIPKAAVVLGSILMIAVLIRSILHRTLGHAVTDEVQPKGWDPLL